jgi:hypothetical protein
MDSWELLKILEMIGKPWGRHGLRAGASPTEPAGAGEGRRDLKAHAGAVKKPSRNLLAFKPVSAGRGSANRGSLTQEWTAADHKFAFSITREHNVDVSPDLFFVARVCRLETFDAAVRRCSNFTRKFRRQVAHHAGMRSSPGCSASPGFESTWKTVPTAPSSGTTPCHQCWRSRRMVAQFLPATSTRN